MPQLKSAVDPRSEAFKANAEHNRALVQQLRDRMAEAALAFRLPQAWRSRLSPCWSTRTRRTVAR